MRQPGFFFYENGCNSRTGSQKSFPRREMNGLSEAVFQNWGGMAKIGCFGQKPRIWAQKRPTSVL